VALYNSCRITAMAIHRRQIMLLLLQVEQTAVENAFRQRRASILSSQIHPSALANNPHILVSEPSVTDFKESSFFACSGSNSRRSSTTSTGPILVPVSMWPYEPLRNQSFNQSFNRSIILSISQPVNQSINETVN